MSGWEAGPEQWTKGDCSYGHRHTRHQACATSPLSPGQWPSQKGTAIITPASEETGCRAASCQNLASALVVGMFAKSYYCTGWRGFRARLGSEQWYMSQHVASTNPLRPLLCPRDGTARVYGTDVFQVTVVGVWEFLKK